jgi:hypothetical protein
MTIETKAEINDGVWYMRDNKAVHGMVDEIKIWVQGGLGIYTEIKYSLRHINDRLFDEKEIHLTKEELLNSL